MVIAEGLETREEYEMLRYMGCDQAQGTYLSEPVHANIYEGLLKANAGE